MQAAWRAAHELYQEAAAQKTRFKTIWEGYHGDEYQRFRVAESSSGHFAFETEAHSSRSARYDYIATADVIAGLRREGFAPVLARQSRLHDTDRNGHTKHLIRFRHEGPASRVGSA